MVDVFKDYSKTSTLYIVRYAADSRKSLPERLFWAVLLVVSTSLLFRSLLLDWIVMRSGPLRVSVDDTGTNVGNLDFPSVTLCPPHVIDPDKLDELVKRVLGPNVDEVTIQRFTGTMKALALSTYPNWDHGYNYLNDHNITPFPIQEDDIIPFFLSLVPSIDSIFLSCFWRGNEFPCVEMLRLQPMEIGFCYSFNSFTGIRHINDSEKNPPFLHTNGDIVGMRSNTEGRTSGFEFFLLRKENTSEDDVVSFMVVTNPKTFPYAIGLYPVLARPTMVYRVEVQEEVNTIESSAMGMDHITLSCGLHSNDTISSCMLACRRRHIHQHCHCIIYTHAFMFGYGGNDHICGISDLKCIAELQHTLTGLKNSNSIRNGTSNLTAIAKSSIKRLDCICKPACSSISYTATPQVMPREADVYTEVYSAYVDVFHFSKWAIGYIKRSKLTPSDLIVGFGGMSGLYLGASMISFIEIIVMALKLMYHYFQKGITNTSYIMF